jgi:hypothetical protein
MTQPKWTDKDDQGNYLYGLMRHETRDHGQTEEAAQATLIKYFGETPPDYDRKPD